MKLTNKTARQDYGETWVGRKKKYEVRIYYSCHPMRKENPHWYYTLSKDDYSYNSLWDDLRYESKEDCTSAAENKVDELVKMVIEVQFYQESRYIMKDVDCGINIVLEDGIYDITDKISGFSLHSGTNEEGIIALLEENSEKIYNVEEDKCCWIYQYSRRTIEDFVMLNKIHNYGDDFTRFLDELLQTNSKVFYIDIC